MFPRVQNGIRTTAVEGEPVTEGDEVRAGNARNAASAFADD